MAADVLSHAGHEVHVFEKKAAAGKKLLIAGSSGLNVSFDSSIDTLLEHYSGPKEIWQHIFACFPPAKWLKFIEDLGFQTFSGSSHRHFLKEWKAARFLKEWLRRLESQGVQFFYNHECKNFFSHSDQVTLEWAEGYENFRAVVFCLGGGSWEKLEKPLRWPEMFLNHQILFNSFESANAGWRVEWPEEFLREADGLPFKNIKLTTQAGTKKGELVVTRYGLEGTPVYALGAPGDAVLDLKPDLNLDEILIRLQSSSENLSPVRRVKKHLNLCEASFALLFHLTPKEEKIDLKKLAERIKHFPLLLKGPQPLEEAISSKGGIAWSELTPELMLKKMPHAYLAGEMIDWTAPTGGYLIQGSISQGAFLAHQLLKRLKA